MSNIPLSYTENGFEPASTSANPGDTITVTNTTDPDITLTFSCGSVSDPLTNITSPVTVDGKGGEVWGDVRNVAANLTITFVANDFEATVEVGPAQHQITVSPSSNEPKDIEANVAEIVVFFNESEDEEVALELECDVEDPLGPEVGMAPVIAAQTDLPGTVQARAAGKKIKITVKGSTSSPTTINVGSGEDKGRFFRRR